MTAIKALTHPFFNELRDFETRLPDGKRLPDIFHLTDEELKSTNIEVLE